MTDTQTDRLAASIRGGLDSRDLTAPRHTVEAFVSDFLRELNYGQGVALARSSPSTTSTSRSPARCATT